MKGTVIAINQSKGLVALETLNGITVFELLGGYDLEVGDAISGNLESLGGETFQNETKGEGIDVFVEDIHCSRQRARSLMSGSR